MMAQDFRRKVGRSDRQGGKQGTTHGRTARAAAFVALLGGGLLPGAVLAQSLTDEGQTLPNYDTPDPFFKLPVGPALALLCAYVLFAAVVAPFAGAAAVRNAQG